MRERERGRGRSCVEIEVPAFRQHVFGKPPLGRIMELSMTRKAPLQLEGPGAKMVFSMFNVETRANCSVPLEANISPLEAEKGLEQISP